MELILVVVISAGMAGNSQNGVSRSLSNYRTDPFLKPNKQVFKMGFHTHKNNLRRQIYYEIMSN